jgi:hypothetical protein
MSSSGCPNDASARTTDRSVMCLLAAIACSRHRVRTLISVGRTHRRVSMGTDVHISAWATDEADDRDGV